MAPDDGAPMITSPVRPLPAMAAPVPLPPISVEQPAPSAAIRVGVIGYGYWGPNLVRNFGELPGSQVWSVSDTVAERLALVHARYPAVNVTQDHHALIQDPAIDAVAIITPVSTHFEL